MERCVCIAVFYPSRLLLLKKKIIFIQIGLFSCFSIELWRTEIPKATGPVRLQQGGGAWKAQLWFGEKPKYVFLTRLYFTFSSVCVQIFPYSSKRTMVQVEVKRAPRSVSTVQHRKHSISRAPAALLTVVILSGCQPELMGCLGSSWHSIIREFSPQFSNTCFPACKTFNSQDA